MNWWWFVDNYKAYEGEMDVGFIRKAKDEECWRLPLGQTVPQVSGIYSCLSLSFITQIAVFYYPKEWRPLKIIEAESVDMWTYFIMCCNINISSTIFIYIFRLVGHPLISMLALSEKKVHFFFQKRNSYILHFHHYRTDL